MLLDIFLQLSSTRNVFFLHSCHSNMETLCFMDNSQGRCICFRPGIKEAANRVSVMIDHFFGSQTKFTRIASVYRNWVLSQYTAREYILFLYTLCVSGIQKLATSKSYTHDNLNSPNVLSSLPTPNTFRNLICTIKSVRKAVRATFLFKKSCLSRKRIRGKSMLSFECPLGFLLW